MKKRSVVIMTLVVAFAFVGIIVGSEITAQMKGPADIQYEKSKGSPGAVTFSHESHLKSKLSCTACHNKVFKMKKGSTNFKMSEMNDGKQCGSCHNGEKAFATKEAANCAKCHK